MKSVELNVGIYFIENYQRTAYAFCKNNIQFSGRGREQLRLLISEIVCNWNLWSTVVHAFSDEDSNENFTKQKVN